METVVLTKTRAVSETPALSITIPTLMRTCRMTEENVEQLRARLEVRERQLLTVHRITAALYSKANLSELLRETLRVSLDTVDADAGSLLLYDREKRRLVFEHVVGGAPLLGKEIDPEEDNAGKAATAFRTGQSLLTDTHVEAYNPRFDKETGYKTENLLTVPLKNIGGEPIGVMQALNKRHGTFDRDDQELLEIVSSLAATSIENARLAEEAQLAAVARAVGDLGHDIKNALTPIETMVDTTVDMFIAPMVDELDAIQAGLREMKPDAADALDMAVSPLRDWYPEVKTSVKDGCEDIREMVTAIADYIKGAQATNMETQDVDKVIRARLRRLKVVAQNRRVTINLDGLEEVPAFAFDHRLIGRAIYNLVNNALGAINDAVTRRTLELRPFTVWVRTRVVDDGKFCLIEVADDGPGIPDRVKQTLFTPKAISTTPGGTGIGTRFVKSVADAHNGTVGVDSVVGQGSRFWMKLPMN